MRVTIFSTSPLIAMWCLRQHLPNCLSSLGQQLLNCLLWARPRSWRKEMLVRSLQSYEETNHFLRAMFLGLVPALLDSNLYRIAINDTQKSMIPTSVHFCSGTCWHFSTGTSVHFSEGTFLHLISGTCRIRCESQSNERQITSNLQLIYLLVFCIWDTVTCFFSSFFFNLVFSTTLYNLQIS